MITHTIESYWIPSQKNNRSRTENVTEQTRFSKSRWNDLEDIGQGQRSSHATHPLMVVIICGKYGNNRSRTEKRYRADTIFKVKVEWPWRYRSRSKVITCETPSHASDHLYQIWKESIKNCRCYRADTIFKAKAKWPWRYRSRSNVIICNTSSYTSDHLCKIWKETIQNCRFFSSFKVKAKRLKNLPKIQISRFWKKRNTRHTIRW